MMMMINTDEEPLSSVIVAQLAGAAEYADCISAEG